MVRRALLILSLLAGYAYFEPSPDGRPAPPILVSPKAGAILENARPEIKWKLAPGTDGAHVEICRAALCGMIVTSYDAIGTNGAPPSDLASGSYFVRASGLRNRGSGPPGKSRALVIESHTRIPSARFELEGPRGSEERLAALEPIAGRLVDFLCRYLVISSAKSIVPMLITSRVSSVLKRPPDRLPGAI